MADEDSDDEESHVAEPPPETDDHPEDVQEPEAMPKDKRKAGRKDSADENGEKWADDDLSADDRRRQFGELRRVRAFTAGAGDAVGGDKIGRQYVYFHASGSSQRWLVSDDPDAGRDRLRDRYVPSPARDQLARKLVTEHVVILSGHQRTGRKATALAALDRYAVVRVCEISSDHPPSELRSSDVTPGDGYIYDASEAQWAKRLTGPKVLACRDILEQAQAKLIVLVTPGCEPDSDSVRECLVNHAAVDPREILERRLRVELPELDFQAILAEVTEWPRNAQDATDLARDLVAGMRARQVAGAEISDVIGKIMRQRPEHYRRQAREVLRQATGENADRDLGRRAFLIAWAVLDGLPAVRICRSAQDLAVLLFEVEKEKDDAQLGLLPFGQILDGWLEHARESPLTYAEEVDRQLHYREGFGAAVLKAVWLDYVVAHEALLSWLERLAVDRDWLVRIMAARALAQLAVYDFDFIVQRCFIRWSAGNVGALHDATAWALEEVLRRSPQHFERIFKLAETWAGSDRESIFRQAAAARLLGSALGVWDPHRSLRLLRRIAQRHPKTLRDHVVPSIVDIFTFGEDRELPVIEQLSDWSRSPNPGMRRLAALCLADLARLDYTDPPPLMATFGRAPALVTELWRSVLSSGMHGPEPWEALRGWSKRGVDVSDLRFRLTQERSLQAPMDFYLSKVRSRQQSASKESVT